MSAAPARGEGLGNQFLSHIRNVDAILHVVRCFEDGDITHVDGSVDPIRDIETIDTELMLADLESVASQADKAGRTARSGDKDAKKKLELLKECEALLSDGKPVRGLAGDDPAKQQAVKELQLLTSKRVLYVANVEEDDLAGENELVQRVRQRAKDEGGEVVAVCARLEAELAELDEEDRDEMLESVGLTEPGAGRARPGGVQAARPAELLHGGEKEIRAWTVPIGATAPQAAGVIHTDFERGFIRSETYSVDDLVELESEKAIREAGKLRVEGKEYVMQDGDVCHFLFNV